jgi:hypothetical protein
MMLSEWMLNLPVADPASDDAEKLAAVVREQKINSLLARTLDPVDWAKAGTLAGVWVKPEVKAIAIALLELDERGKVA